MNRMSVSDARQQFADVVNRVRYGRERICLERSGADVACMVSVDEARLLELIEDRIDLDDALEALEEIRTAGAVSWDKFKEGVGA